MSYIGHRKPDIIALIKDRQYNFKKKIEQTKKEESLMKEIWDLCQTQNNPNLCEYYRNIADNNSTLNMNDRRSRIESSEQSMIVRYRSLIGLSYPSILYSSYLDDEKRKIITRWRLSSHRLHIETERYTNPKTIKENRTCRACSIIEDEHHAIFKCKAHRIIRERFQDKLDINSENIQTFLNPDTVERATYLSAFLNEIEQNMDDLNMI